jgi:hypothetical protein
MTALCHQRADNLDTVFALVGAYLERHPERAREMAMNIARGYAARMSVMEQRQYIEMLRERDLKETPPPSRPCSVSEWQEAADGYAQDAEEGRERWTQ